MLHIEYTTNTVIATQNKQLLFPINFVHCIILIVQSNILLWYIFLNTKGRVSWAVMVHD